MDGNKTYGKHLCRLCSLRAYKTLICCFVLLACGWGLRAKATDDPVGKGLYQVECGMETWQKMVLFINDLTGLQDTTYTPYDTLVCRLVPITDLYSVNYCDSVYFLLSEEVKRRYVGSFPTIGEGGLLVNRDSFAYDTLRVYAYEVHCRQLDTLYHYDTIIREYSVLKLDTAHSSDNLAIGGPEHYTDSTLFFDPHVFSKYYPYGDFSARYRDSINALIVKLNQLLATWPEGLRCEPTLEERLAAVILSMNLPEGVVADTAAILDSLQAIRPITPAYYRAWIAALQQALARYSDTIVFTQEYHIDSVKVLAVIHTKGGGVMVDTFSIRTIPLFYQKLADTSVQFDHEVCLWAGSPQLPDGSGRYADITWYPPLNAATGAPVTPRHGFSPGFLNMYDDVSLTDSVHIRPLLAQGGVNLFASQGPMYIADTLDGDSLLFPIKIKATPQLRELYPNAPEQLCEINDTIKVRIIKGYKVNGYVSYAGLWIPSSIGDNRSPDAPVFDGDLGVVQQKHLPIANARIYLYDMDGQVKDSTMSDDEGYYVFANYQRPGKYRITARSPQKTSVYGTIGLNGNDATWIQNYVAMALDQSTLPGKTNPQLSMWWWASNVDLSENPILTLGLDGNDATAIQNKVALSLSNGNHYSDIYNEVLDDWVYSTDTLVLEADTMHHVRGVMRGDADRNYNDQSAASQMKRIGRRSKVAFNRMGKLPISSEERFIDYPVLSLDSGYLSGFQLFFYFNTDKVDPMGVGLPSSLNPERSNLVYNVVDDQILTTWINKDKPYFHVGDTLLVLHLKLTGKPVKNIDSYFKNNLLQYVVSDTLARIVDWKVALPQLDIWVPEDTIGRGWAWEPYVEDGDTVYEEDPEVQLVTQGSSPHLHESHILSVIPNPISAWGDATYHVSGDCLVNLKLYSLLGENVLTFVDGERQQGLYRLSMNMQSLPSGIYILRLETAKNGKMEFDIVKIIVKR